MLLHRLPGIVLGLSLSSKIPSHFHPLYLGNLTWSRRVQNAAGIASGLPKPPKLSGLVTEEDNVDASAWVAQFGAAGKIPKELVELSFSRSSGPGGQACIYSWESHRRVYSQILERE